MKYTTILFVIFAALGSLFITLRAADIQGVVLSSFDMGMLLLVGFITAIVGMHVIGE